MADVAGLVLGVAGLAGLFSSCVDCFDHIDTARRYEHESEVLIAKFHIQHVRLYIWGTLVGITGKIEQENLNVLAQQQLGVKICLDGIKRVLTSSSDLTAKYGLVEVEGGDESQPRLLTAPSRVDRLRSCLGGLLPDSKSDRETQTLDRAKWAICDRRRFVTLVEDLKDFIDGLHGIMPAIQPRHNRLVRRGIHDIRDPDALDLVFEATEDEYPGE